MGVVIEGPQQGRVTVHGVGLHGLKPPPGPIYLGNSGTSMRLLSGLLAAQPFDTTLTGDASLSKRPMNRVAKPLREMGAVIETAAEGRPPLTIRGGQRLSGMHYDMPMASAQVKSCLLLAGLYAADQTSVTEPAPTRDHTERMLRGFGYPVTVEGRTAIVEPGHKLRGTHIEVPADISSAAFFMVAASIAPGSEIVLEHVGVNPTRTGVIDILKLMGGDITLETFARWAASLSPISACVVRSSRYRHSRRPGAAGHRRVSCALRCRGMRPGPHHFTRCRGLRVKESDRIQVMADGLQTLGIKAEPTPDGIVIEGGMIGSGEVWAHGDHRIAMSFSVAALRASGPIRIHDCANVATSFPNFLDLAQRAGMQVQAEGAS